MKEAIKLNRKKINQSIKMKKRDMGKVDGNRNKKEHVIERFNNQPSKSFLEEGKG